MPSQNNNTTVDEHANCAPDDPWRRHAVTIDAYLSGTFDLILLGNASRFNIVENDGTRIVLTHLSTYRPIKEENRWSVEHYTDDQPDNGRSSISGCAEEENCALKSVPNELAPLLKEALDEWTQAEEAGNSQVNEPEVK
ncbi:hypothetical protein L202_01931 [Cryptococcus amylolentus CBS 6039]|uniref:Uncharacterized protein n=1 Tax=Cryptococcus amylolentus CBS 6039 TaxID=1295533 RepID=A0A1E3HYX9_9TREE|nr:hypothetical protein L202_01931 [Cryptococcus amylolentus CBS 6039]ODN81509.1 hypothetical protein L202_01931 [Cryptococcus amylolentus CBS 6039]